MSKLPIEINQLSNYNQLMNYSFEYIDIILLAMIAGFIFLRLRGILGKRTGFEGKVTAGFDEIVKNANIEKTNKSKEIFDDAAQSEFLKGAKIAYETIIKDFSDNDNKIIASKNLLDKKILDQFNEALSQRVKNQHVAEITFISIQSATIKEHKKIISGDPEKVKKIYDTWVFSRNINSNNPNWQLVNILT